MTVSTPLVFRPSLAQRTVAALLCAGSWIVGIRTLALLLQNLPRLHWALRQAQEAGEPTAWLWVGLVSAISACFAGGVLLLLSVLALVLVEGSQVLVDELGIVVDLGGLPGFLARRMGAGRLVWKEITAIGKGNFFFLLQGGGNPGEDPPSLAEHPSVLRFLVVDELERLVLIIIERSPNLRFKE
jgi:hypothetical protein